MKVSYSTVLTPEVVQAMKTLLLSAVRAGLDNLRKAESGTRTRFLGHAMQTHEIRGLVLKADRLAYHSTLGLRVVKKKIGGARPREEGWVRRAPVLRDQHQRRRTRSTADGSGCRVQGSGFRVQGAGFRVQGSGSSVQEASSHAPLRMVQEGSAHAPLRSNQSETPFMAWRAAFIP